MEFIKILFNSAFAVLPLLIILQLQIIIINPVLTVTPPSAEYVQNNVEIATTTTSITTATTVQTATTIVNNNNNKNNTITKQQQHEQQQHEQEQHEQRKREQIIDNSIDFTVEPCDDFYQYACGEWKQQMYGNNVGLKPTTTTTIKHSGNADADVDIADVDDDENGDDVVDNFDRDFANFNATTGDYMYDRTLAMIGYMADKEVLKYFHERNRTKFLNKIASTTATATATATPTIPTTKRNTIKTNTTTTTSTTATKEPDLIIKVYKYYKSCITIEQYEPIRYLEWLELNEHVKWPSLINNNTTTANSEEHNDYSNEKENTYQKEMPANEGEQQQQQRQQHQEPEEEEIEEIMMDDDNGDGDVNDTTATTATTTTTSAKVEDNNAYNWIKTLAILRRYGMNGIFIEEIIYNTKTYPSKLFLGFSKPIQDGGFKSLKMDNLRTILLHLNESYTEESFKELWLKVTKFEWQLIKLNDINDELGTLMVTLKQLPVTWLHDYMMVIFNQTQPLDMNMRVIITNVGYFLALDDLIKEYDEHFLQQYLKIRFLWYLYQQEPHDFSPLECIQHIKRFQPLAFEWIYEQRHREMKKEIPEIQNIYSNIRRQFNLTLYNNRNNFASAKLEKFVTKLESIQIKVGTFIDLRDEDVFYENRKFYKTLKLSSRLYYTNRLKMLKFNFDCLHFGLQNLASTSIYYDMKEYSKGLASAAYFNTRLNTLNIPLSLLQPPIYHKEYNDLQKYTTLGFILAQTLMYGFDLNDLVLNDQHQQFKCLGNLNALEVSDKIADVSGFRLAYHTFFHSNAKNLISNRKMFFLNFAHTFCATRSSDDWVGRSYVNYALAQFQEFAKVFECPPDSHMNPHEKCYLWD